MTSCTLVLQAVSLGSGRARSASFGAWFALSRRQGGKVSGACCSCGRDQLCI
jgi:hypothetical protein